VRVVVVGRGGCRSDVNGVVGDGAAAASENRSGVSVAEKEGAEISGDVE